MWNHTVEVEVQKPYELEKHSEVLRVKLARSNLFLHSKLCLPDCQNSRHPSGCPRLPEPLPGRSETLAPSTKCPCGFDYHLWSKLPSFSEDQQATTVEEEYS